MEPIQGTKMLERFLKLFRFSATQTTRATVASNGQLPKYGSVEAKLDELIEQTQVTNFLLASLLKTAENKAGGWWENLQ